MIHQIDLQGIFLHVQLDHLLILLWFPNLHLGILKAKLLIIHRICFFFGRNIRGNLGLLQLLYAPVSLHRIWVDCAIVDTLLLWLLIFVLLEHVIISDLIESYVGLFITTSGHRLIRLTDLHRLVWTLFTLPILWNFIWLIRDICTSDKHFDVFGRYWWQESWRESFCKIRKCLLHRLTNPPTSMWPRSLEFTTVTGSNTNPSL